MTANRFIYETSLGYILLEEKDNKITKVHKLKENNISDLTEETELLKKTIKEIREFLDGDRKEFDVPILMEGTEFQKSVWKELQNIPYGETRTYKEIAAAIGNEKASRAVGMANNRNPIMLLIPCHRVIGSKGKSVGFGAGIDVHEKLLDLEKANK